MLLTINRILALLILSVLIFCGLFTIEIGVNLIFSGLEFGLDSLVGVYK